MRAVTLQLLGIPLPRDTNHKTEVPIGAGLHPGNGILEHKRPLRLNPEKSYRHKERIRADTPPSRSASMVLPSTRTSKNASNWAALRTAEQSTGGDDGNFEPIPRS